LSHEWYKPAYATRLGNLTAKSVLVLIADQMNGEGFGWPSIEFISHSTEINRRTVLRVFQIFVEMELVAIVDRGKVNGKRKAQGIQLNTEKLGSDLAAEFARLLKIAQGRTSGSGKCLRDTGRNVSETQKSVSETQKSVSETFPPHPHIGGPVIDPLMTHSPTPQRGGGAKKTLPQEDSRATRFAIDAVMQGCGFTSTRLRKVIRDVARQEADKGVEPRTTALGMMAMWKRYAAATTTLRFKWSATRFFAEGHWHDPDSWPWDMEAIRAQQNASVGTLH
jgi:hypothetical protein